jgi:hypothetical protein
MIVKVALPGEEEHPLLFFIFSQKPAALEAYVYGSWQSTG